MGKLESWWTDAKLANERVAVIIRGLALHVRRVSVHVIRSRKQCFEMIEGFNWQVGCIWMFRRSSLLSLLMLEAKRQSRSIRRTVLGNGVDHFREYRQFWGCHSYVPGDETNLLPKKSDACQSRSHDATISYRYSGSRNHRNVRPNLAQKFRMPLQIYAFILPLQSHTRSTCALVRT